MTTTQSPLRIGNVSASRGDRATATAEFLDAATLDVLALDMLSDEAVLELAGQRVAGGPGYERAAVVQIGECLDRLGAGGVRIVTNAGALDPEGL
ncbi:acyclic terpene utilization AtuA family protein, partial [Dietzia sp. DQ12-76]